MNGLISQKNLFRLKSTLANDEAVHSIEALGSVLGVGLNSLEQQSIDLERVILQNEPGDSTFPL